MCLFQPVHLTRHYFSFLTRTILTVSEVRCWNQQHCFFRRRAQGCIRCTELNQNKSLRWTRKNSGFQRNLECGIHGETEDVCGWTSGSRSAQKRNLTVLQYHSDSEPGLGPTVSSLSLGSMAHMHFRLQSRFLEPNQLHYRALSLVLQHVSVKNKSEE